MIDKKKRRQSRKIPCCCEAETRDAEIENPSSEDEGGN